MFNNAEFCGKPLSYYALEASEDELRELRKAWKEMKQNPVLDTTNVFRNTSQKIRELEMENERLRQKLMKIYEMLGEE